MRIFGAHRHANHSATIYTLAGLRCLSDDCSGFKREITPIRQNKGVEIRITQLDLRCRVVQAYDRRHRCV